MIRVVVFDFDGTLVDSNGIKEACLHRTVADRDGGAAALAAAQRIGSDHYQLFSQVALHLSPAADAEAVAAQTRSLIDSYTHCCAKGIVAAAERRGARRALAELASRSLHLWVLSATPDRPLIELLRRRGLLRLLRGALGPSVSKEQGLRRIMAAERSDRNTILLVGDSQDDQIAARATGIKYAAVVAEKRVQARGRFAIRDLTPLVALVDGLNNGRRLKRA
jgi:phosphoglycolate phosphatase